MEVTSTVRFCFPIVRNSIITLFLLAQVNFVLWAFNTIFFNGAEGKPISCLESIFYIFFGKHDFVASIGLGSLNDNESALKTHPYKHKFYCFVVPYSGVKYLFYLCPFRSKVHKNPFVHRITILICIGWT